MKGKAEDGVSPNKHVIKLSRGDGKFVQRKKKFNPISKLYLLTIAWGVGKNYATRKDVKKSTLSSTSSSTSSTSSTSSSSTSSSSSPMSQKVAQFTTMIDSLEVATAQLTPKKLYQLDCYNKHRKNNFRDLDQSTRAAFNVKVAKQWEDLDDGDRKIFEHKSRQAIARQPAISGQLVELFQKNGALSYHQAAQEIDNWCSGSTINRWLVQHSESDHVATYGEQTLPLLLPGQKKKHQAFAESVGSLWGQPGPQGQDSGQKYLWIHYDEKWFWGLVNKIAKR